MFGWGFFTATIIWVFLIEWRTGIIRDFIKNLWIGFKEKIKNIISNW